MKLLGNKNEWAEQREMSIHVGLRQRSEQAHVFDVMTMKDNKDEQVNNIHINNCFNQTISQFVRCKLSATDVLTQDYVDPTQFYILNACDCDLLTSDCESSSPLSH